MGDRIPRAVEAALDTGESAPQASPNDSGRGAG